MIDKYKVHPSLVKIKSLLNSNVVPFHVQKVDVEILRNLILALNNVKSTERPIPVRVLKAITDTVYTPITACITLSIRFGIFPISLKLAETIFIPKRGDSHSINDYRPVSVLPTKTKLG